MNTVEDIEAGLPPFTEHEREVQKYLGMPVEGNKESISSVVWLTGTFGELTAQRYLPSEKLTSKQLVEELNDYWKRVSSNRPSIGADPILAVMIGRVLIDYYQGIVNAELWFKDARRCMQLCRGNAPSYIFEPDPAEDLVYFNKRTGWE